MQELEESEYWLELLGESRFILAERLDGLRRETGELKGLFVSIVRRPKRDSKLQIGERVPVFLILLPLYFILL